MFYDADIIDDNDPPYTSRWELSRKRLEIRKSETPPLRSFGFLCFGYVAQSFLSVWVTGTTAIPNQG